MSVEEASGRGHNRLRRAVFVVGVICLFAVVGVCQTHWSDSAFTWRSADDILQYKAVIILVPEDDDGGKQSLKKWSALASGQDLALFAVCKSLSCEKMARRAGVANFSGVNRHLYWSDILDQVVSDYAEATVFGLIGEGTLPHKHLKSSAINGLAQLFLESPEAAEATAVCSRVRRVDDNRDWMPDQYLAQVWVNRAFFHPHRLSVADLDRRLVLDFPMLDVITTLTSVDDTARIDGTVVVPAAVSASATPARPQKSPPYGFVEVTIGSIEWALKVDSSHEDGALEVSADRAPWPPPYLLDTVATADKLVMVSSVNCGYLDMAENFVRSIRRTSEVKILLVAMDDVAYNFLDGRYPGTVVRYLAQGEHTQHAVKAGAWGDSIFKHETTIRPSILIALLDAGYNVLWTDVDMVWLKSPLPLLPHLEDDSSAELMLQVDGKEINKCTCFMFMKATSNNLELMRRWQQAMVDHNVGQNQAAFQGPLDQMIEEGIRLDLLPNTVMPTGKQYFDTASLDEEYRKDPFVVHNNWIIGHDPKVSRFEEAGLWAVGNTSFPSCIR